MAEDSYATVGLDGPAAGGSADPSLVEDNDLNPTISLILYQEEHLLM